ncbi:hypothetical protein LLEC1_02771 [Akanthomyces lecanii]|uniref:DUF4385 domain-containing protein n=1 Tax=Cordyceps confragosa TaxID=2714763 RepID=A0A179I776_CORDF|nr:hypothetical protein LLEC1_02771 [Akanthomyces lecanii]
MSHASEQPRPKSHTPTQSERMAYRIGRGEQGVFHHEPYKSALLPLWRFRTVPLAEQSAADLWARFEAYGAQHDFVGMDMARKYIQMGMTRAKRYANHAGGLKYKNGTREELPRSERHAGKSDKERASQVFREYWERCKRHEGYNTLKEAFISEQKKWDAGT